MSILLANDTGWIISHQKFFEKIKISGYDSVDPTNQEDHRLCLSLNPNLFEITKPFRDSINAKGKPVKICEDSELCDASKIVKALADKIFNDARYQKLFDMKVHFETDTLGCSERNNSICEEISAKRDGIKLPKNNIEAYQACQQFFEAVKSIELPIFHGENPLTDVAVLSTVSNGSDVHEHKYVFPPETKFYCNDVRNMEQVFRSNNEEPFDLILLDPPWWNKFIRRRKRKQQEAGYVLFIKYVGERLLA